MQAKDESLSVKQESQEIAKKAEKYDKLYQKLKLETKQQSYLHDK
jgi:hypothetical protein